jgi:ketosteroid isomerase-like protein
VVGLGGLVMALSISACGGSDESSASQQTQEAADKYAIEQIESDWHKASSTKDVDLMMSLWAPDATFNNGSDTLTGKAEIRKFFETTAGPFRPENHWLSDTPAYKIRVTVNGDKGTLYFECHYVDTETQKVVNVVGADQNVQKINGRWLITSLAAATPTLSP